MKYHAYETSTFQAAHPLLDRMMLLQMNLSAPQECLPVYQLTPSSEACPSKRRKCPSPQLFLILLAFFFTQVEEINFNTQHYIHDIILSVFFLYGAFGVCIKKSLPLCQYHEDSP